MTSVRGGPQPTSAGNIPSALTGSTSSNRHTVPVLGAPIDVISMSDAITRITTWGAARESRYVCICNVHSVVTASGNAEFKQLLDGADLATPDGAPVAWAMRRSGATNQERVTGPDLMLAYFDHAERNGEAVLLYGSTESTLAAIQTRVAARWPNLRIVGAISPPFRPLSPAEDRAFVDAINASGASTVWVGLGCPKQEKWMAEHRGQVFAPMIGVGAAFDFLAGSVKRAPPWMRNSGLEWLHRLLSEPRRLWRRYLVTNTLFVIGIVRQTVMGR